MPGCQHYIVPMTLTRSTRQGIGTTTLSMPWSVNAAWTMPKIKFTQRLYDALQDQGAIQPPDPVDVSTALEVARELLPQLVAEDGVVVEQLLVGEELDALVGDIRTADGNQVRQWLQAAFTDSRAYYERWIAKK